MSIQAEKAQAAESYIKFQQAFIKHFYRRYNQDDSKQNLPQVKARIIKKWNSFKRNVLQKMYILYRNQFTLEELVNYKLPILTRKINKMLKNQNGFNLYKQCEKMFQIKHFPFNLKFQFQNQIKEQPKTPVKKKVSRPQLLRTSSTSDKKQYKWMTEQQIQKLGPKQKAQLQIQWLEEDYKNIKKDIPDIFDLILNFDPILPLTQQKQKQKQQQIQPQKELIKNKKLKK